MPKEMTDDRNGPFVRTADGHEFRVDHPDCPKGEGLPVLHRAVQVGWRKGYGYVEIGAAAFHGSTQALNEGCFLDLDRAGINRLIRTLRKARDQAFGADA